MAQQTLGIDLSNDSLNGVVVVGKGKERKISSFASVAVEEYEDIRQALPVLLDKLSWKDGDCISSLPLSMLSVRNLSLPFTNEKKIEQILPFELEEHMLVPVKDQVLVTVGSRIDEAATRLLIATVEKRVLREHLEIFQDAGLEPHIICPSCFALADAVAATNQAPENFLLLYADLNSISLVICAGGKIMFMRHFVYPEEVITEQIFIVRDGNIVLSESAVTASAISRICQDVQRTMDYLRLTAGLELSPEKVVLAGPLQAAEGFAGQLEQNFDLPVISVSLARKMSFTLEEKMAPRWLPSRYDRPLALALQGRRKKGVPNFRRDEFAAKGRLLGSRKQRTALALAAGLLLCALFGYQIFSYQSLKGKYDSLAAEMNAIFRKSFPEVGRIVDPLLQMRTQVQAVEAPTVAMPLFTDEKRILAILADISARIPAGLSVHVSHLVIDRDSVRIKGTTDAFNNVNRIEKALDGSSRYAEVNIVSATKSRDNNTIRFEIRMQLREQS